jgi:hypothetical protein
MESARGKDGWSTLMADLNQLRLYSFCKGHAINYAQLVWALAYHKTRDPKSFWESALVNCQSMYKTWVHVEEAKFAGCIVVPGSSGRPVVIKSTQSKQGYLFKPDPMVELQKYGFWTDNTFFPDSFVERSGNFISFKGLIGSYRRHKGNTFINVGTGIRQYHDVVIPTRLDIRGNDMIIGEGRVIQRYDHEVITVKKYKLVKYRAGKMEISDWITTNNGKPFI